MWSCTISHLPFIFRRPNGEVAGFAKDPLGALGPPVAILVALALASRERPLSAWLPWPSPSDWAG